MKREKHEKRVHMALKSLMPVLLFTVVLLMFAILIFTAAMP